VQLATAALGPTVDCARLLGVLRGWANSFSSQSTNPLQLSLKVDSIPSGVRMTLIEVRGPCSQPCVAPGGILSRGIVPGVLDR